MRVLAVALLLLTLPAEAAEVHFSPRENLEEIDVGLLDQAKASIDIAVYAFTSTPVMEALRLAALRGVKVRIYRDRTQVRAIGMVRAAQEALAATPGVEIRFKQGGAIMHLKAYAVDGAVLRTGSANFTHSGLRRQDNDLMIDRDLADVGAFERDFEDMWGR